VPGQVGRDEAAERAAPITGPTSAGTVTQAIALTRRASCRSSRSSTSLPTGVIIAPAKALHDAGDHKVGN